MSSNFVARGAEGYDSFMGRWSRRLAPLFLDFAGLADGERIAEVGCGTGSMTFLMPQRANIAAIEAIDYEPAFVEAARERNRDPRITIKQGDATKLDFTAASFDRALALLVLHFVSDAPRAIAEMKRVVRPGGTVAAAVWDLYGGFPSTRLFWEIVAAIEPSAEARRDGYAMRPTTQPGEMQRAFVAAGLQDVSETMLPIRMDFANFEDYWLPLVKGQGTQGDFLASMPEATRERIERAVRSAYLCGRPDGPRSFGAIAWAVRGVKPG